MNQPTLEPILYALDKIINRTVFAYHIAEPVVEALLDEVLCDDLVLTLQRQQQRVTILELHTLVTSQKHAYTIVRHDEPHERASTASALPYHTTLSLAMSTMTRLPVLYTEFSKVKSRIPWLNGPVNITPP